MRTPSVCAFAVTLVLSAACGDGGSEPPPPPGVISLAIGETRTLTSSEAATIEVSGGSAGGEFVLIPFHGSTTPSSTVALEFNATQITGVTGPPSPQVAPAGAGALASSSGVNSVKENAGFHLGLRRLERDVLASRMPEARAAYRSRTARGGATYSVAAAVPAVGDQLTLNTARSLCGGESFRTGTVVAVTQHAVVLADNANPAGGFTPQDYIEIGQEFDTKVYPVVTQNFGTPEDIDQNGSRVVIFYTRAVNELSAPSSDEVVGGFFHPRDLFPKSAPAPEPSYCGSNVGEMFYMLVPDPTGQVNGNVRQTTDVRRATIGVLAHEFQHLVNGSRRLYVNNASDFEEVWLNEGLSHIAEELMFYQASGRAPKQNLTLQNLQASATTVAAVNAYQVQNFARLIDYLENPEGRSPYADDDELATRGATWQLLRYTADQKTTPQQTLWFNLANSRVAGIANFNAVFGVTFINVVRDWATAQYTDDVVSTPATFQHPSWHYRSILRVLINNTNPPPHPLKTRPLVAGTPLSLSLVGGGAAYLRFGVASNATGKIIATSSGAALPAAVSLTVVRTR